MGSNDDKVAETEIRNRIVAALWALPDTVAWVNNTGKGQLPGGQWVKIGLGDGSSDIVGAIGGRIFFIEVKTPKMRNVMTAKRKDQEKWQAAMRAKRIACTVACSIEEATSFVTGLETP